MSEHPESPTSKNPTPEAQAHADTYIRSAAHTRRAFLFKLSVLLNAAVGAVLSVPLIGYLLGPALRKSSATGAWIALGNIGDFPVGATTLVDFRSPVASFDDGDTAKVAC